MSKSAVLKKEVEVVETDLIVETAKFAENLTKEEALASIPGLIEEVDYSYFRLGGILSVIQSNSWWKDDGHDSFKNFIEAKFGIAYRKSMYLLGIYNSLVEANIPWSKVKGLGWTKLKELADILTIDNVDEWVAKALTMTVLQLQEEVKKAKAGTLPTASEDQPSDANKVSTLTFKCHTDQKETINMAIEKAMKEANTEFPTVALEAICIGFLSGGKTVKQPSLLDIFKTMEDPLPIFEAFEARWPHINVKVEMPEK